RTDQGGNLFGAALQCQKESLRRAGLIDIRRLLQQGDSPLVGGFFRPGVACGAKVMESVPFLEVGTVEEGELRVHAMAKRDVRQFVGKNCSEAGFVGKNVNQAAADNDRVAQGKRLERGSHEHAAADI